MLPETFELNNYKLVDTPGSAELDRMRPCAYQGSNCFAVCYSAHDEKSLFDVMERWLPELKVFAPNQKKILVCVEMDMAHINTELNFNSEINSNIEINGKNNDNFIMKQVC